MVRVDELFRSRVVGPATSAIVGAFTRVQYPFADRTIDVAIRSDARGLGTTVAAPCKALDGFLLALRHDDAGTRAVRVGNAAFQRTYAIETSDRRLAIELLDAPTRGLIAFTGHVTMPTRRRDRCYSYTVAQGFVSARAHATEESGEALEDAILAVDAIARRPEGIAAAWRRTAAELGAEVRGETWTVGGELRVIVPSASGAYTVTTGARPGADESTELATMVIDDAHAVAWIDSLTPDPARIRAAIAALAAARDRTPYR